MKTTVVYNGSIQLLHCTYLRSSTLHCAFTSNKETDAATASDRDVAIKMSTAANTADDDVMEIDPLELPAAVDDEDDVTIVEEAAVGTKEKCKVGMSRSVLCIL